MIYPGSELELFSRADNWKAYWSGLITSHIKGSVLEVGAGIGTSTIALSDCEMDSWTCLEPDPNLASQIQIHLNTLKNMENYEIVIGDINKLSGKKSYDTILYIDVLEHIKDDRRELKDAVNLLSEYGKIIILGPAHQWLYSKFDESIGHYRRYDKSMLTDVVPEGLKLVQLRYLDSVGLCASMANRLILDKSMPTEMQIKIWDQVMVKISCYLDPLLLYGIGKSIFGIWSFENK